MPINVKISLCKITRASKLFQRNYYLPLLKPLSPKDALRRKIITGQNVLGNRVEHYIPVLASHDERSSEKKKRPKGAPVVKKKVKLSSKNKYLAPFLDEDMENHTILMSLLARKGRGKGQHYTYDVFDKNCILVLNYQMEKAIKDKEIIDVIIAQRSEKIVVKLKNDMKISLPIAPYDGSGPLYRGGGWTKEHIDDEHHHGKETMSIAKIFEAKESGVEEWELEMMRLANKRKKKTKGPQETGDWKAMMSECLDNMDWDKFEDDSKQIVEEIHEVVEEENIPMAVDDMEKTKNVADKLKQGGEEVLSQLPTMKQVPEVIKILDQGDLAELANVSGVMVKMSNGNTCFITGQMVKSDENEVFVPGQTLPKEDGTFEYVPGITVYMEGEPTLIPGLVMGEEESPAIFLPGESTITEEGQLKFEGTEADFNPDYREPSPPLPFSEEEPDEEEEEEEEAPPPPPVKRKPKDEPVVIRRRVIEEPQTVVKERVKKRPPVDMAKKPEEPKAPPKESFRPKRQPLDDPLKLYMERLKKEQEEEKKRLKEKLAAKLAEEEMKVDKLRITMWKKYKNMKFEKPKPFVPMEPVKKSNKLAEMEENIHKGTFLEDDRTKAILENVRSMSRSSRYTKAITSFSDADGSSGFGFSRIRVH